MRTVLMDQGFHAAPHRGPASVPLRPRPATVDKRGKARLGGRSRQALRQRSSVRGARIRFALLKTLCHQPFRPRHCVKTSADLRRHRLRGAVQDDRCKGSAGGVCGDMGANLRRGTSWTRARLSARRRAIGRGCRIVGRHDVVTNCAGAGEIVQHLADPHHRVAYAIHRATADGSYRRMAHAVRRMGRRK